MRLASVTLKNFRCYLDEKTIVISDLTALIGKNDVGKSAALEALEIFFNNETVKIDTGDCSVDAPDRIVEITCEFSDLPDEVVLDAQARTSLAAEHLLAANGNLRILKRYRCTSAKPKDEVFVLAQHPTADQYADLLELSNTNLKKRLRDLDIDETGVPLNSNPAVRAAIWAACPDLNLAESTLPVSKEDGKRIWENLREHLPIFALFQSDRASKDSDAEVQDPMKLAVAAALADAEVQGKLAEVVDAVRARAVDLATRTHRALARLDGGLAGQLTPDFKTEPKWGGLFSVELASDRGIPVNKRGSGVRRMILVSFFQADAERRLAEAPSGSIIYAIEEPETSQHPISQRLLLEAFEDLAAEPNCQVLISTHSPGLASYLPIDSFRFIKVGADGQPEICVGNEATWDGLVQTLGVVPDNRVRALVCVEGPTDVAAISCMSQVLHAQDPAMPDLSADQRVAFVVLGGGTLKHWVNEHYLRGLNRPEVHLYDSDVAKYGEQVIRVNARGDGSWAAQSNKREIENYLHPDAIREGVGVALNIGDADDVPALVGAARGWNPKTAKNKLAKLCFPRMTAARLQERDPNGEVAGWLRRIGQML